MKHLILSLGLIVFTYILPAQTHDMIKSVFFGGGSSYIDPGQAAEIKTFIESIPDLENYQISISSHTDNIGGVEYNNWLSGRRSDAVTQQLNLNNIPPERVSRIDNGQFNPLYDNRTMEGRMANRRVDIILTPLFL